MNWTVEGEKNTTYFYTTATKYQMVVFYRNLFSTKKGAPYTLDCLPVKRLTSTAALDLERSFEEPENWEAVKFFGENKAL